MAKHPIHSRDHEEIDTSNFEGRATWFFKEFWPIMVWAGFFVLMCAIPLTLSGMFPNPFATSTTVWPVYGLIIALFFACALLITFIKPGLLGLYMLLLGIYMLIIAEQGRAWAEGSSIAILFLIYVTVAILVFMASRDEEKA